MAKLVTIDPESFISKPWIPSHNAYDLIRACEGLRLIAYPDSTGHWTIGYGHTRLARRGQAIGEDEAEELLQEDVEQAAKCLNAHVQVKLTQDMVDALTDWIFNLGCEAFRVAPATRLLNEAKYHLAAKHYRQYDRADNRVLTGLVHRRAEEYRLFLSEY